MRSKSNIILLLFTLLVVVPGYAAGTAQVDTTGKRIFLLGEDEKRMEKLGLTYQTLLMEVCQNNMEVAYDKWMVMLTEMEAYAERLGLDIKGTKMYMNVYWNTDGSIDYIGYYLKPNSRNIKTEEFSAFLLNFVRNYKMDLQSKTKFFHNGSVSFPTHYKFLKAQEGKK